MPLKLSLLLLDILINRVGPEGLFSLFLLSGQTMRAPQIDGADIKVNQALGRSGISFQTLKSKILLLLRIEKKIEKIAKGC